jgi:hypothetical protein
VGRCHAAAGVRFAPYRVAAAFLRNGKPPGPAHRPPGPRRVVAPPLARRQLRRFRCRNAGAAPRSRDAEGGSAGGLRRGRDARAGHGRRGDGHYYALARRPLVGGAGESRQGFEIRRHRSPLTILQRDSGARYHRPSAVLPRRPGPHLLRRPAHRPAVAREPRRQRQPAAVAARAQRAMDYARELAARTARARVRRLAQRHARDPCGYRCATLDHALSRMACPPGRHGKLAGVRHELSRRRHSQVQGGENGAEKLCEPRSSSVGAHWAGPFPYNDGPREVYAPQHTHPHPRPSPDGSRVLYTSDATGHAQLYEVLL